MMHVDLRLRAVAACTVALLGVTGPTEAHSQVVRYAPAWAREAHEDEPLFRPYDVLVLPGCEVWLSDPGNARVFRWDCTGRPLPAVGRRGGGPGEFEAPSVMRRTGADTVAIWDDARRVLSFFDRTGQFLSSRPVRVAGAQHGFVGAFHLLPTGRALVATDNWPGGPPRPNESSSLVWMVDATGRVERSLLRVAGPGSLVQRGEGASTRLDAPFQRRPTFLFDRDGSLLVGNNGESVFFRYAPGERLAARGRIDLRLPRAPVTRRDRERWADSVRARAESELERVGADESAAGAIRARVGSLISGAAYPATHTAYSVAILGDDGHLWVQLNDPRRRAGSRWQVHDARTGALLRALDVPTAGRVKSGAVHQGALFLVEIDGDDVGRLVKYVPAARGRAGA